MKTPTPDRDNLIACVARASLLLSLKHRGKGPDPREYCLEQYCILELAEYYGAVNHVVLKKFLGVTYDKTIYNWLANFCSSGILAAHPAAQTTRGLRHYSLESEGEKLLKRLREQFIGAVVFPGDVGGRRGRSSRADVVAKALAQQARELKKH